MRCVEALIMGLLLWPSLTVAAFIPENRRSTETITLHVSPLGNDTADGTSARPLKTLARVQQAVRAVNANANVIVVLGDGVYRLSEPLRFRQQDGGQEGKPVVWQAAPGASPVI